MEVSAEEFGQVWHRMPKEHQQAFMLALMELRVERKDAEIAKLQHQVGVLEEAIKMPGGFARTNHSTPNEDEFIDGQLAERLGNRPDFELRSTGV